MNAFCYKFISGYDTAKFIKIDLRFARVIDKSLLARFLCPTVYNYRTMVQKTLLGLLWHWPVKAETSLD